MNVNYSLKKVVFLNEDYTKTVGKKFSFSSSAVTFINLGTNSFIYYRGAAIDFNRSICVQEKYLAYLSSIFDFEIKPVGLFVANQVFQK
ncbi:hypothetical protein [Halobacillus litoralis]|uniref:hypothetical protein n=1 Tax=Halobacillus litoralis TaxID=45668 RepID=UPI0013718E0D|nr:hypothetical protein [Halobacillus litoralis]